MGEKCKITLDIYEGSIVPILWNFPKSEIQSLQEEGVEILNLNGSYLVYVKEYSKSEQVERLGDKGLARKFHQGYSLKSFFISFPHYVGLVEALSLEKVKPFLSEDELNVLLV
mmetsp:Transcript_14192/g.17225  ORF Transcript_14192/g.17225 Transcript_14192/m.17225 type:complete len:113 (+) Transcript_14192:60-398(+)